MAQYACLQHVCHADSEVVVVSIYNGQQVDARAVGTARDTFAKQSLVVYLVIITEDTYDMGVAGHVLELELVLDSIHAHFDEKLVRKAYSSYRQVEILKSRCYSRFTQNIHD